MSVKKHENVGMVDPARPGRFIIAAGFATAAALLGSGILAAKGDGAKVNIAVSSIWADKQETTSSGTKKSKRKKKTHRGSFHYGTGAESVD